MKVARNKIHDLVIECLLQTLGAKPDMPPITNNTDPINELGLESLDGLAFACLLSEKLRYQIPEDINPLVNDKKKRARKVGEIVDLVNNLLSDSQEEQNARS